jgi:hypothetical protein
MNAEISFEVRSQDPDTKMWPYSIRGGGPGVRGMIRARNEHEANKKVRTLANGFKERLTKGGRLT